MIDVDHQHQNYTCILAQHFLGDTNLDADKWHCFA